MSRQSEYKKNDLLAERLPDHTADQAYSEPELATLLTATAQAHTTAAIMATTQSEDDE